MFFLTNITTYFQVFSVNFCWIWTKCKETQYLMDKTILGNMGGVYATSVTNDDKEHWHAVTYGPLIEGVFKITIASTASVKILN